MTTESKCDKSILYFTSSLDRCTTVESIDEYYQRLPYGHAAVLYNLVQQSWQERRLALQDSLHVHRTGRTLTSFNPSVVFTNSVVGLMPVLSRRLFSRWRGPIVHGWDDFYDEIWRLNFGWLAGHFMRWFERQIILRSDYIITISRHNQKRAEAWGKKTWYIPNGCIEPEYDPAACKHKMQGEFNLVYCGDQDRYKKTYDIVQAMSQVPKHIKLYLIGNPYEYLKPYASDNVIFLGRLSENDKWSLMSQADVLVCTADTDCNAKFHEYMRMQKPILAYDGIPNCLFTNRRNALLTKDYPSAIMELYQTPELCKQLTDNASNDIPVYTWQEIAKQYDAAFEEIIQRHGEGKR